MTLDQIKEQCRKVIELGERTTQREWKSDAEIEPDDGSDSYIYVDIPSENEPKNFISVLFNADWGTREDADFIALSRQFTPAAAQALLLCIEGLEENAYEIESDDDAQEDGPTIAAIRAQETLQKIVDSWPK